MPLQIIRNDITKMHCDAIVNAANSSLLGGGGVDGAIHAAAGPRLLEECRTLGGCLPGQAKLTRGYGLRAKYVIHTVGPVWQDGSCGEKEVLRACYRNCLAIAQRKKFGSVAFPLISAGAYGYPREEALRIATETIARFLEDHEMLVYLVVYDREVFQLSKHLFRDIEEYIDEAYLHAQPSRTRERNHIFRESFPGFDFTEEDHSRQPAPCSPAPCYEKKSPRPERNVSCLPGSMGLDELINQVDESFSQMLLRKIDEKGITDAQCYKKANIDRKHFSKIRKDVHYKPSKQTAIAFAISLELPLEETRDLLQKAGFALSHSSKFDIIIEYFIQKGIYDIYKINEALFAFDQILLGG